MIQKMYIADTFNQKPKTKVFIGYLDLGGVLFWYITESSNRLISNFYLWKDNTWNDHVNISEYHSTKDDAENFAKNLGYEIG